MSVRLQRVALPATEPEIRTMLRKDFALATTAEGLRVAKPRIDFIRDELRRMRRSDIYADEYRRFYWTAYLGFGHDDRGLEERRVDHNAGTLLAAAFAALAFGALIALIWRS